MWNSDQTTIGKMLPTVDLELSRVKHLYFRTYAEFNGLIYEEQISVISSFVDGTVVYGTDKMLTKTLRQFS